MADASTRAHHRVMPTSTDQFAIWLPLAVGISVIICTILIHSLPLSATIHLVRREMRLGWAGPSLGHNLVIVVVVVMVALAAHLIEIALWAGVFVICGEFTAFGPAFDHSAVNYTTLGYGNVVMTPSWRLLGPLEAADGMLMFGITTAMILAVIQRFIRARHPDMRD